MKQEIPLIEVDGKNYDIGYRIGQRCKKQINGLLNVSKKKYSSATGKPFAFFIERSKKILDAYKRRYSPYIDEIKGMSDGAGINFDEYFTLNLEDEIYDFMYYKCTTLFLKTDDGLFLGHNEDWTSDFRDKIYILNLKQKNNPNILFLSYLGPPQFIIASINSAGIAFTANSLYISHKFGIPEALMLRSVADARNVREAIRRLEAKPREMGMNSMIISKKRIVDVENSINNSAVIDVNKDWFVHTNHPLKLKGVHYKNSVLRFNRVTEMLENSDNKNMELVKTVLSDHKNYPAASICRHPASKVKEKMATVASIIIDIEKSRMLIAHGNPCKSEYREYKLG